MLVHDFLQGNIVADSSPLVRGRQLHSVFIFLDVLEMSGLIILLGHDDLSSRVIVLSIALDGC
jgi:hypothetical protein